MTTTLNLPCIWAIVSSLSMRSFSAVSRTLGTWIPKKTWERPLNQPCQYFSVSLRFTCHPQRFCPFFSYSLNWPGKDTRADSSFLTVQELQHHLIALCRESKCFGLSEIIWFMKGSAYKAVPSTTSIITQPTMRSIFYMLVSVSTTLQAMEPPKEWPTTTTFLSGKRCMSYLRAQMVYELRVQMEKSSLLWFFLENPWPLRSKATRVPKCFTYLAKVAKLSAEWPAPWIQKNSAPDSPALKTEVPQAHPKNTSLRQKSSSKQSSQEMGSQLLCAE